MPGSASMPSKRWEGTQTKRRPSPTSARDAGLRSRVHCVSARSSWLRRCAARRGRRTRSRRGSIVDRKADVDHPSCAKCVAPATPRLGRMARCSEQPMVRCPMLGQGPLLATLRDMRRGGGGNGEGWYGSRRIRCASHRHLRWQGMGTVGTRCHTRQSRRAPPFGHTEALWKSVNAPAWHVWLCPLPPAPKTVCRASCCVCRLSSWEATAAGCALSCARGLASRRNIRMRTKLADAGPRRDTPQPILTGALEGKNTSLTRKTLERRSRTITPGVFDRCCFFT